MTDTPDSYATTPREEDDSPPASPRPAGIPPLSETRTKNVCYSCGDPGLHQIPDGDGAASVNRWACRDCYMMEPESCEQCEEAARLGKAAVCGCEKIRHPKKKTCAHSTPASPAHPMDERD